MSSIRLIKLLFLSLACLFAIVAVILSTIAVFTPSWQVVYINEFRTRHQHGLWIDCASGKKHVGGSTADSQHCTYKFGETNDNLFDGDSVIGGVETQHKFHPWHKMVLCLIFAAILCGFIAISFAFCAFCVKICALVFSFFVLLSTILSIFAIGVFFVNSHHYEFRFVTGVANTYEQSNGYSFWLQMIGVFFFLLSFLLGIVANTLIFLLRSNDQNLSHITWPNMGIPLSETRHLKHKVPASIGINRQTRQTSMDSSMD